MALFPQSENERMANEITRSQIVDEFKAFGRPNDGVLYMQQVMERKQNKMDPVKATEVAYKNGYTAGTGERESAEFISVAGDLVKCSECGKIFKRLGSYKFCPYCGRKAKING